MCAWSSLSLSWKIKIGLSHPDLQQSCLRGYATFSKFVRHAKWVITHTAPRRGATFWPATLENQNSYVLKLIAPPRAALCVSSHGNRQRTYVVRSISLGIVKQHKKTLRRSGTNDRHLEHECNKTSKGTKHMCSGTKPHEHVRGGGLRDAGCVLGPPPASTFDDHDPT